VCDSVDSDTVCNPYTGAFPPQGKSSKLAQDAYWRQAARELQQWDALLPANDPNHNKWGSTSLTWTTASNHYSHRHGSDGISAHYALQRAAELGHPHAQHYLANAYASGIWPFPHSNGDDDETATKNDKSSHEAEDRNDSGSGTVLSSLYVSDEWSPSQGSAATSIKDHHHPNSGADSHHNEQQQQLNQAFLWWRMAAMGGNIEAAVALAHRIALLEGGTGGAPPSPPPPPRPCAPLGSTV